MSIFKQALIVLYLVGVDFTGNTPLTQAMTLSALAYTISHANPKHCSVYHLSNLCLLPNSTNLIFRQCSHPVIKHAHLTPQTAQFLPPDNSCGASDWYFSFAAARSISLPLTPIPCGTDSCTFAWNPAAPMPPSVTPESCTLGSILGSATPLSRSGGGGTNVGIESVPAAWVDSSCSCAILCRELSSTCIWLQRRASALKRSVKPTVKCDTKVVICNLSSYELWICEIQGGLLTRLVWCLCTQARSTDVSSVRRGLKRLQQFGEAKEMTLLVGSKLGFCSTRQEDRRRLRIFDKLFLLLERWGSYGHDGV